MTVILTTFVTPRGLGRVVSNNAVIQTEREPDMARGDDVAYYGFARLPRDCSPVGDLDDSPEIDIEVGSPFDRWPEIQRKVGQYLNAGALAVCVLDPDTSEAAHYRTD